MAKFAEMSLSSAPSADQLCKSIASTWFAAKWVRISQVLGRSLISSKVVVTEGQGGVSRRVGSQICRGDEQRCPLDGGEPDAEKEELVIWNQGTARRQDASSNVRKNISSVTIDASFCCKVYVWESLEGNNKFAYFQTTRRGVVPWRSVKWERQQLTYS